MFSAMKQVKQLKISGWPTIFGRDQKNMYFWPFLAFEGRLGGLKDPLEVRVQHETCSTINGTPVQAILDQKNLTGLAGGIKEGQNMAQNGPRLYTFLASEPSRGPAKSMYWSEACTLQRQGTEVGACAAHSWAMIYKHIGQAYRSLVHLCLATT